MTKITITDAVRIIFFENRHHPQRNTAIELAYQELISLAEKNCWITFERSLGDGAVLDAIQSVLLKTILRENPIISSHPPPTENAARAYLRMMVTNYLRDRIKEKERMSENELNENIYHQRTLKPKPDKTTDAEEENPGSIAIQWLDPKTSKPEAVISQILDELERFSANQNQQEQLSEFDPESQKKSLEEFRKAVFDTCNQIRSPRYQVSFAETLQRIVRCALRQTTMEAEVDKIIAIRGGDRKKIRNTLDQQNSRTINRIYKKLIQNGVPEPKARKIVSGLAVRCFRRSSPKVRKNEVSESKNPSV